MAFIWKDTKSGVWYLDYTPPGGRRARKRVGTSKQAAQLALKEMEYQLSFDRAGVSIPDISLKEFFTKYEETIQPKLRPKSWPRYRAIIDHFRAFIGGNWEKTRLQQLRRELFEQYVAWRRNGGSAFPEKNGNGVKAAKTKTVNTELDMLASMFNKAVEWRYLSNNPAKSIPRLKEDDRKPFRFFSLEEIQLLRLVAGLLETGVSTPKILVAVSAFHLEHQDQGLIEEPSPRIIKSSPKRQGHGWLRNGSTIVEFLLATGSREEEVLGLEWSWIDLKRRMLSYRRRTNWVPKGSERDIALRPELVERLRGIERINDQPRVFLDWDNKPIPPRTFERGIQRLIRLSRIPRATLHDFRHTFASHLAMAGVPLPTLQKLLGHHDIQTVMIYAHLSPSHIQKSVEALPF